MADSNITPIRAGVEPQAAPDPMSGWVWDGQQWLWMPHPEHPIWPPQPWPPCPPQQCAPQPRPPSCFSQVAKAQACYDQSQALYNLVSQVVTDIFTKNPGIIPAPPASAGSGPIIGVTDGSAAAPGEVGEIVRNTVTGTVNATSASSSQAFSAIVLPPGDWDVQSRIEFTNLTGGVNFDYIDYILTAAQGAVTDGRVGIYAGFPNATVGLAYFFGTTNLIAVNTTVPTLLTGTVNSAVTPPGTATANYSALTAARRRR